MASKKRKLAEFRPQERNANQHTPRGLGMLDDSIARNGWIGAITTAADGETFDGSARLETVYTRLGEEVEPIVVESDGTRPVILKRTDIPNAADPKAVELAIAANRIASVDLQWDSELLAEINSEIDLSSLFTDDELANLLAETESTQPQEEDEEEVADLIDRAESGAIESRAKLGEVWKLGRHYIACGDSTDESNVRSLMAIAGVSAIDMVWADPPYNIDYQGVKDKRDKIANDKMPDSLFVNFLAKALFPAPVIYCCCSWQYAHLFRQALVSIDRPPKALIVWDKINPAQHLDKYFKQHELIFYFGSFGGQKTLRGDVWQVARQRNTVHPTMKPVEIVEMAFSDQNDVRTILDPFLGSAPSILAAQKMEGDRVVVGFELSPEYIEVICRRFEQYTGINAELIGSL